jgi:hypothetical protein
MNIWYLGIFQQSVEKIQVSLNSDKNNGHTNLHFWSYLSQFSLEWNIYRSKAVDKIKTHIICSITFFSRKLCFLWECEKKNVEPGRPQMTIRHISIACWVRKATYTRSEYVILTAFPLQQWLHERTSVFRTMPALLNSINYYQASTAKYLHTTTRVWLLFELV